ncbi:hypothetical protein [Actinoplanes regularis]|uniref:hypothetical protein n=1 Tax=Actinoplanes regularis TaxID=52697 RepID=UPI0015C650DE|nr:hypothetical protein [Actinoplanes regularis]
MITTGRRATPDCWKPVFYRLDLGLGMPRVPNRLVPDQGAEISPDIKPHSVDP